MAAPKNYQQDTIGNEMNLIQRTLQLQADIALWSEKYGNNSITDLGTADIQSIAAFEHLTAAEVAAGKTALDTVATAITTNRAALVKVLS